MDSRVELTQLVPDQGTYIELGVAAGHHARQILTAHESLNYIGVDAWADHHNEAERLAVVNLLKPYQNRCILLKMRFTEALTKIADNSADLIYVDGYAHTGQEAGQTLGDWWSKVKPGGIFSGHDYHIKYRPTVEAVDAFARLHSVPVKIIHEKPFPSWMIRKPFIEGPLVGANARVILVGNGPSLRAKSHGPIIDTFDEVIRFNECRVRSFEPDVGSKTTVWVCNGNGMWPADRRVRPNKALMINDRRIPGYRPERLFRVPHNFYGSLRERLQTVSKWTHDANRNIIPSSGLLVAAYLLEQLNLPRVWIAGIDHFCKKQSSLHHYWDERDFTPPGEHDGQAEAALLAPYFASGRISRL